MVWYTRPEEEPKIVVQTDFIDIPTALSNKVVAYSDAGDFIKIDGRVAVVVKDNPTLAEHIIIMNDKEEDWLYYINIAMYIGGEEDIEGGQVIKYVNSKDNSYIYRFISTAFTGSYPTEDAWYREFVDSSLSGRIIGRFE